jgi:enoyl-CoA hydratase
VSFGCTKRALATATLADLDSVQAIVTEGQLALVGTTNFVKASAPSGSR